MPSSLAGMRVPTASLAAHVSISLRSLTMLAAWPVNTLLFMHSSALLPSAVSPKYSFAATARLPPSHCEVQVTAYTAASWLPTPPLSPQFSCALSPS